MALKITYREGVDLSKKIADMLLSQTDYSPISNLSFGRFDALVDRSVLVKDILEVIRQEVGG